MIRMRSDDLPEFERVVGFIVALYGFFIATYGSLIAFTAASEGHGLFGLFIALISISIAVGIWLFECFIFSLG